MDTKNLDHLSKKLDSNDLFLKNYQSIYLDKSSEQIDDQPKSVNLLETKVINPINIIDTVSPLPWLNRIYCINLESCQERKKQMKSQFKKHGLKASFFNAIYPLHREFKKRYTNPKFVDQNFNQSRCFCVIPCNHRTRKLRRTEVAISLSHYFIYDKICKKKDKWSLVCEDDLIFHDDFIKLIDAKITPILDQFEKPTIIFCGGAKDNYQLKIKDQDQFKLSKLINGVYSNYCYLINYEAAKILHRKFFPINRPEDSFKRYWIAKERIQSFRFQPVIVGELSSGTNFESVFNRYSLFKAPPKIGSVNMGIKKTDEKIPKKKKSKRVISYNSKKSTIIVTRTKPSRKKT